MLSSIRTASADGDVVVLTVSMCCPPSSLFLDALQAFGGVAEDAKAIAGVGGSVSPSANRKSRLPDLFNQQFDAPSRARAGSHRRSSRAR